MSITRRYEGLTEMLRGQSDAVVVVTFTELDRLVGGLPASARKYPEWWVNTYRGQPHAKHWLDAGRRARPDFNGQRVSFELGAATAPKSSGQSKPSRRSKTSEPHASLDRTGEVEEATFVFEWLDAGEIQLDWSDKLSFSGLPSDPGIYRFTLTVEVGESPLYYIGESDNLARRMGHYRNPGPSQQTNQRLNNKMRDVLDAGGVATLSICLAATVENESLDLTARAGRLLIENAALVSAARRGDIVENL